VLRHPSFRAGGFDTAFLDRHPEVFAPLVSSMDTAKLSCLAAALAGAASRRSGITANIPIGWRNVGAIPQVIAYDGPAGPVEVCYRFDRAGNLASWSVRGVDREDAGLPGMLDLADPGSADAHPPVAVVEATPERVSLDVTGIRVDFSVNRVGEVSYIDSTEGSVTLVELPRFPVAEAALAEGSLLAPLPGSVSRVLVVPGQRVAAGDLLLTLEAMKLEHPVLAPAAGVVADMPVAAGTQVETGAVLAVITAD
jgi:propionyl-CoA carboxylase alpha chain